MVNRIAELRKEKHMTQEDLARKSNVSRTTIWALEKNAKKTVTSNTLIAIADALGVEVGDVFFTQKV